MASARPLGVSLSCGDDDTGPLWKRVESIGVEPDGDRAHCS